MIFFEFFWYFRYFKSNIKVFGQNNLIFEFLQQKWCRIIMKFGQNIISGPEMCEIGPKVLIWSCPDLSRRTHMAPYGPICPVDHVRLVPKSFYIIDIYGYSLYIPFIFHIYFLAMWSMFSLVCFLIYGVKRRSGHVQIPTFDPIWHASGPKLSFWRIF